MAAIIQGTIKNGGAFEVEGKKGKQVLISFNICDEVGNLFACQMWQDDPQHAALQTVIAASIRRPVHCTVAGYSVRMRKFKDGRPDAPQANFIVTGVTIQGVIAPAAPAVPAAAGQ